MVRIMTFAASIFIVFMIWLACNPNFVQGEVDRYILYMVDPEVVDVTPINGPASLMLFYSVLLGPLFIFDMIDRRRKK